MIEYTVQVYDNGTKHWYLNNELHREDGPAIEWSDGDKYWYLNNKKHREGGPAIENASGYKAWYLNGEFLTKEEWENRTQHTIVIDGKEIKLSKEIYNNLKRAIGE